MKSFLLSFLLLFAWQMMPSHAELLTFREVHPTSWPDFPVIYITTVKGELPTCRVVYPPEGCVGVSITDNDFVAGRMVMTLRGDTIYDSGDYVKDQSGMRFRIRGNSTGAGQVQRPYKLKLSKKADLLNRGDKAFDNKNWALLSMHTWNPSFADEETNLLTLFGGTLGRVIGMEWQPAMQFVNVNINGNYVGLYYLIESVAKGEKRIDLSKRGFLIENDAYWWNEGDQFFQTAHQHPSMGFTFKEPDETDAKARDVYRTYMDSVENAMWNHTADLPRLIDFDSWARWVLTHDFLNDDDVMGSNMFLYVKDFNPQDYTASPLKMGPLWDFDASFRIRNDGVGIRHDSPFFYFQQLFKDPRFVDVYNRIYQEVVSDLLEKMRNEMETFYAANSKAFDESGALHQLVYGEGECRHTMRFQMDELMDKFEKRVAAMDSLVKSGIPMTEARSARLLQRMDLSGRNCTNISPAALQQGIYVDRYSDGTSRKWLKR